MRRNRGGYQGTGGPAPANPPSGGSSVSSLHNTLSRRFVMEVVGPAIKSGASFSDFMVLIESCQFAALDILARHYEQSPQVAVGLMEASLQRAIERFAAANKGSGR